MSKDEEFERKKNINNVKARESKNVQSPTTKNCSCFYITQIPVLSKEKDSKSTLFVLRAKVG